MIKFFILFLCVSSPLFGQKSAWVKKPKSEWPQIAMVNEVWYKNGERYVDPSFQYAGTGFLIDTGSDTLAATAKHVLWVAKTKTMNTVDLHDHLQRWVMHPKGNLKDSVVIEQLINRDTAEILNGAQSTITQRDWILFTTGYVSPKIQPLTPRYKKVNPGERIYYFGCPYNLPECVREEATVLEVEGNRIVFSFRKGAEVAGASGSPLIDESGLLIGILSGSTFSKSTGGDALYATSTHYLRKVLQNEKPLNVPLIPIGDILNPEIQKNGINSALNKFHTLKAAESNFFVYDFSLDAINAAGDYWLQEKKPQSAIALYKLSLAEFPYTHTYTRLANAYLLTGEATLAIDNYQNALKLWPENKEAIDALKRLSNEHK
jgi:tetratricopeptide (TPR) repeat protein